MTQQEINAVPADEAAKQVPEEEQNVFDEINEDEFSEEEETLPEQNQVPSDESEVKPGSSTSWKYIANPAVGESVLIDMRKVVKKPGRQLKNKETGAEFWTGLKSKKGTDKDRVETILETVNNERFTISSWGLYFKLFGKDSEFEQRAIKAGTYEGIMIKITHVYNGKDAMALPVDIMKLRDFKTIEEATAHKKKVAAAIKSGDIYKVEFMD